MAKQNLEHYQNESIFYRRGVEQRAFASSNTLRVAPTHSASLSQLVEEGAMIIRNKSSVHYRSKFIFYRRGVEQSGSSSGS